MWLAYRGTEPVMADETTTPATAASSEPAPRRRAPRRAASRPAGAPDPGAATAASHPEREPEQQVDVLAAFGLGATTEPATDDAAPKATTAKAAKTTRATKTTKAPKATRAKAARTTDADPATAPAAEPAATDAAPATEPPAAATEPEAPAGKRATRSRSRAKVVDSVDAIELPTPAAEAGEGEAPAPKATRTRAKRTSAKKAPETTEATDVAAEPADGGDQPAEAPAPRARRSRAKKTQTAEAVARELADADATDPAEGIDRAETEVTAEETPADVVGDDSGAEPVEGEADEDEEADEAGEDEAHRLPATALLFQAPSATPRRRRRATRPAAAADAGEPADASEAAAPGRGGRDDAADVATADTTDTDTEASDADTGDDAGESAGSSSRRRRRRGGRGRRRSGDGSDEQSGAGSEDASGAESGRSDAGAGQADDERGSDQGSEQGASGDGDGEDSGGSRRRRRRRGRRGDDDGGARAARDEVTALRGSTRLEAKRLRRREGRDAGRRRTIITEAEFLARRESVQRDMVVREQSGMTQIAVLEDGVLVEHYVARAQQTSMVGNVYLGRVQNVLPSMEAAFVDLGRGRNAVLYAGEVNWEASGLEGQPRRIEQALKSGDQILVQVTKDPIGHKGARLTSQITLAGRYLVLVPSGAMTGISRKLPDTERARLKKLLKEIVPEGQGVIVRTAAEGASEDELRRDVERLTAEWSEIQSRTQGRRVSAPALLKGEPELALRVVRDVFNEDFSSLTIAGAGAWKTISEYVEAVAPDLGERLHHWTSRDDVFASKRIDEQLAKGMDRKVWLPSGGSLVIDRTEAMTVVDVNTGKFTGSGGTLEETVTRNNLEAAEEIVRQLRLRDIGGIIVIDFIDMVLESNRDLVLRRLIECLGRDRTRHQVAEVTSLGLVQMTRKRVGQGLVEAFSTPCEHCHGRGFTVDSQPHEHAPEPEAEEETPRVGRRRGGRSRGSAGSSGNGSNGGNGSGSSGSSSSSNGSGAGDQAAREAVKATLAQIAAAAQQAHQPHDADGTPIEPGSDQVAEAVEESVEAITDELVVRTASGPVVSQADRLAALAALEAALPGAVDEAVRHARIEAEDDVESEEAVDDATAAVEEVLEAEIVEQADEEPEVIEGEVVDPKLLEG
ncbi:ribonuclease E [Salana multivorans]|uniref:Ribonuclease E n=2 Tax=Salana multivorans TaxID=120377 RepID=A0A3N2D085_9MICO|nr:ribonuclease E [Salana multivorans]